MLTNGKTLSTEEIEELNRAHRAKLERLVCPFATFAACRLELCPLWNSAEETCAVAMIAENIDRMAMLNG